MYLHKEKVPITVVNNLCAGFVSVENRCSANEEVLKFVFVH